MDAPIQDLSFSAYTERQYRELEPTQLLARALTLKASGNYLRRLNGWDPQPYPGFAVVSMVEENPGNATLPAVLKDIQDRLLKLCPWEDSLYLLPASSFHQTVANTLSEGRFIQHILGPGLEEAYPGMVSAAFDKIPVPTHRGAVRMKLIGLALFGTALGLLGVFEEEEAYLRILHFRAGLYADPRLAALDVKRTRPFIGHITIAYMETDLPEGLRAQLAESVHRINQSFGADLPSFILSHTELRRYEDLSEFRKGDGFPSYIF